MALDLDFSKTVLIGSIFYSRHKIVSDHNKGIFDKERAEELIYKQEELSDRYGIPSTLDVIAETGEAMIRYLDFIIENYDKPFVLDGYVEARITGINYAKECGFIDKIIYNSINTLNTAEEIEVLKDAKVKSAIIFAYDSFHTTPSRRLTLLSGERAIEKEKKEKIARDESKREDDEIEKRGEKESYKDEIWKKEGLISKAKRIGIENIMIDVVPTDVRSLGDVIETSILIRSIYEYPVGCGPANVFYYVTEQLKEDIDRRVLLSSVISVTQPFCDFILYGAIENSKIAFQSAYIIEEVKESISIKFNKFLTF